MRLAWLDTQLGYRHLFQHLANFAGKIGQREGLLEELAAMPQKFLWFGRKLGISWSAFHDHHQQIVEIMRNQPVGTASIFCARRKRSSSSRSVMSHLG